MSQTYQKEGQVIQAALFQAAIDNPDARKDEIFTLVMKKLDLDEEKRPAVRRCKGTLLKKLALIQEVLK